MTSHRGGLPTPPLDDDELQLHTIDDMLIERARTIPDEPLVGYPESPKSASSYVYYTARDLDRFANGAAQDLVRQGLCQQPANLTKTKVIALLGLSNLDYAVSIFALSRLGYAVMLLSTRLSTEAYLNLLRLTECNDVVVSNQSAKLIAEAQQQRSINCPMIPTKDIYSSPVANSSTELTGTKEQGLRHAFIIHSSGSTGLPKPIFQTHKACLHNYSVSKGFRAYITLPLFHNHGLSTFFRSIFKGRPVALYNADLPLTGPHLLAALRDVEPESFHGVPYALKLLAEVEGGTEALSRCEQVLFGGSSCPDDLGDKLVAGGVRLISHYGATEMGQLMTSERPDGDQAWNYVRPLPKVQPYLKFVPHDDGSFECVCLDGLPSKVASNADDPPNSFYTSDCFQKHPTIRNAWKYLGRVDDRVTLLNGEKVLPIPIEHRIRQSVYVKDVLVFGVGKAVPGLLVVPSEQSLSVARSTLLDLIWPDIQAANKVSEGFSQISSEMVQILEQDCKYPATDKGTMIRRACYKEFAQLIEDAYTRAEQGSYDSFNARSKLALSAPGTEDFLLNMLSNDIGIQNVQRATDLYLAGVDSLQAIKMRSNIKRDLDLGSADLGQNAIFECATVEKLAAHIVALRTGQHSRETDEIEVMAELIKKYSNFERPIPEADETIMLTGVTGSLGPHVLALLLINPRVKRVFCLLRASSHDNAFDRTIEALSARQLPLTNMSKLRCFAGDLSQPNLGLDSSTVNELHICLTKVIHVAWAVNFNLGVQSFEHQHIRGVHNLINMCLSSRRPTPAEFFFCSSISAAAGTPLPATIPEGPIEDISHAQNMGYARSKLVAEHIVAAAAKQTGMVARTLRVGQIVGDSMHGHWNPTEAIPLMIQSAKTLGALPALDETPSWLPVDAVAQALMELCGLEQDGHVPGRVIDGAETVYHVQNSRTFHWTNDLLPALREAGLHFETISQREWVQRLRDGEQDPAKNPTVKLVDFFANKYDNDNLGRRGLVFEMEKTEAASNALRGGINIIGTGLIKKFVDSWHEHW